MLAASSESPDVLLSLLTFIYQALEERRKDTSDKALLDKILHVRNLDHENLLKIAMKSNKELMKPAQRKLVELEALFHGQQNVVHFKKCLFLYIFNFNC